MPKSWLRNWTLVCSETRTSSSEPCPIETRGVAAIGLRDFFQICFRSCCVLFRGGEINDFMNICFTNFNSLCHEMSSSSAEYFGICNIELNTVQFVAAPLIFTSRGTKNTNTNFRHLNRSHNSLFVCQSICLI